MVLSSPFTVDPGPNPTRTRADMWTWFSAPEYVGFSLEYFSGVFLPYLKLNIPSSSFTGFYTALCSSEEFLVSLPGRYIIIITHEIHLTRDPAPTLNLEISTSDSRILGKSFWPVRCRFGSHLCHRYYDSNGFWWCVWWDELLLRVTKEVKGEHECEQNSVVITGAVQKGIYLSKGETWDWW